MKETIQKWKYSAQDYSICYPFIKTYLLVPIANYIPYSVSPNIISLIGLMFTLINAAICYYSPQLTFQQIGLICFFQFLAFFFDALDGRQGIKWKDDKRDVYVLTQLYDHGIDSITGFFNVYIVSYVFEFSSQHQKLLWMMINATFLISILFYKIKHHLVFGVQNNPTEVVLMSINLMMFSGYFQMNTIINHYLNNINTFIRSLRIVHTL